MNLQDGSLLLHECFRHRAGSNPDETAVEIGGSAVTYRELADRVDRIASGLRAAPVEPGSFVGLHLERSVAWVAAQLAVMEVGSAVVPLPPSYPRSSLESTLAFAGVRHVIEGTDHPFRSVGGVDALEVESLQNSSMTPAPGPAVLVDPDQPAYVLSSSGSTGRPKLMVRSHRSFFHRLHWTWRRHPYRSGEVCCQKAHMTTTHAVYELFEPLLAGTPCIVVPDAVVRDLEAFWALIRARAVTRLLIVPSMLRATLEMPGFGAPKLSVVVLMGEHVDGKLASNAVEAFPGASIYSIYGSTEASSVLVSDLRNATRSGMPPPLGTPIAPSIEAVVLNEELRPVGLGQAGRLHIGGPALFSGYFGEPERTREVLVTPPGRSSALYDTRDRVEVGADGALTYVGRVDHVVKIRGFRVDLVASEEALLRHPVVGSGALVVDASDHGQSILTGFVTPSDVDTSAILADLRAELPDHAVPSSILALDSLPLTPSGKIDRVGLLSVARAGSSERTSWSSPAERAIAKAWSKVLGHGRFGRDSSFFEVGGTSLSVFSLLRSLRETLELDDSALDVRTLHRHPSVSALAAKLEQGGDLEPGASSVEALVHVRRGENTLPRLFLVSSAGGTVGAYERMTSALTVRNAVVGVRDPFLWGQRDPREGFNDWVGGYLDAILAEQDRGPYCLCAYSSAGAFGLELARQLEARGATVGLLALVDPLALACRTNRYGHWAFRSTWSPRRVRALVRAAGWGRLRLGRRAAHMSWLEEWSEAGEAAEEPYAIAEEAARAPGHLSALAVLLQLNSGVPIQLSEADFEGIEPDRTLALFQERVQAALPDVEGSMLRRLALQYSLQVRTQHAYHLAPVDAPVLLVEPRTRYAGLLRLLLGPYVPRIEAHQVALGPPSEEVQRLVRRFSPLQDHYRSMRDETFVAGLAGLLSDRLRRVASPG